MPVAMFTAGPAIETKAFCNGVEAGVRTMYGPLLSMPIFVTFAPTA
jgi:hypothetical protein